MYYDIYDIETQGQRIQVESLHPDLAEIEGFDVGSGTSLTLPLWLAGPLACVSRDGEPYTHIKPHPAFATDVLNALRSDPRNVDLQSQCPVFFALAQEWLTLFQDDDLREVLVDTAKERTAAIYERASALLGPDQRYEEYERKTHSACLSARKDLLRFLREAGSH